ncbi:secreted protein [Melampsora americana]|nr:secreted protein [Melampsora americana]
MTLHKKVLFVLFSLSSLAITTKGLSIPKDTRLDEVKRYYNLLKDERVKEGEALKSIGRQLEDAALYTADQFQSIVEGLIESHLRRNYFREQMVEYIPSDPLMDTNGLEYFEVVGRRYTEETVHSARELKSPAIEAHNAVYHAKQIESNQAKFTALEDLLLKVALPRAQTSPEDDLNVDDLLAMKNWGIQEKESDDSPMLFEEFSQSFKDEKVQTKETEYSTIITSRISEIDGEILDSTSERIVEISATETVTTTWE